MKKLENWIIKIIDKKHFDEVVKVLNDFGYDTEYCNWLSCSRYGKNKLYCYYNKIFISVVELEMPNTYSLEEFVKAHNNFKNMKFRISSKEEGEKLQKYLFSLGYEWRWGEKSYFCEIGEYNKFLYTLKTGKIGWGYNEIFFTKHSFPEYTLEEITTYELKEVVKVHCKNCGKEINPNEKNHFKFNNGSYLCWDCFKEVQYACFPF